MEEIHEYDYLVCLSLETTRTENDYRSMLENGQESLLNPAALLADATFPNVIEMDWISYWLRDQKPDKERTQHFIKPTNMPQLNAKTVEQSGVTQAIVENAKSLEQVLKEFRDYVYSSFVLKNKSYWIITFGNWEMGYQLRIESLQKKFKLDSWFSKFFNLCEEFKKGHPGYQGSLLKIEQLLDALKLK